MSDHPLANGLAVETGVLVRPNALWKGKWWLQAEDSEGAGWTTLAGGVDLEPAEVWWLPDTPERLRYVSTSERKEAGPPSDVQHASLTLELSTQMVAANEQVAFGLQFWGDSFQDVPATLHVSREAGDAIGWLQPDCDGCLSSTRGAGFSVDSLADLSIGGGWIAAYGEPVEASLFASAGVTASTWDGPAEVPVASVRAEILETGAVMAWGDLHAHSNLSADGCEQPEDGCSDRDLGQSFFVNAAEAGLDFAAMTEHAEYGVYTSAAGESVDIWLAQHTALQAAPDGFYGFLGFEWTSEPWASTDDRDTGAPAQILGGHKTVIFQDPAICQEVRVAATDDLEPLSRGQAVYQPSDGGVASTPAELEASLLAVSCGSGELRALTFFHHTATAWPQATDFDLDANMPGELDRLIEVYSEHGAFECADPIAGSGCEFGVSDAYVPAGSVQNALSKGYRVGFVANTDSHDGLAGSVSDGPSYSREEDGELVKHGTQGGLTGVFVSAELSRSAIFDGLMARHTVATSGPRPRVVALAQGADGDAYLPGELLPNEAWPIIVRAEVDGADTIWVVGVGGTEAEVDGDQIELEVAQQTALWLRARLTDGDVEHRVWVSPWFSQR